MRSSAVPFVNNSISSEDFNWTIKQPYSRNMWIIMREFKVLPTDPRFQELTSEQIAFILSNMEEDVIQREKAFNKNKGDDESFRDPDTSWYEDEFTDIDYDIDYEKMEESVARIENEEAKKRREQINEMLNEGNDTEKLHETELTVQNNIQKALEEAKDIERLNNGEITDDEFTERQKLRDSQVVTDETLSTNDIVGLEDFEDDDDELWI